MSTKKKGKTAVKKPVAKKPEIKPAPVGQEVKPGMLIRNLRFGKNTTDSVLCAGNGSGRTELFVATEEYPSGIGQWVTGDAEVRWPWEPETAWRRVSG